MRYAYIVGLISIAVTAFSADAQPVKTEPTPAPTSDTPAATTTEAAPVTPQPSESDTITTTENDTPKATKPPKPPTDEDIGKIIWQEFSADNSWENPFAHDLESLDDYPERRQDWDNFLEKLAAWAPGQVPNIEERVRNLLCVCTLEDIGQGQFEAELPLHVYRFLRKEIPDARLKNILAMTAFYPDHGTVIETAPELNLDIGVGEQQVRFRLQILAVKMLGRMLGKLPYVWEEEKQP